DRRAGRVGEIAHRQDGGHQFFGQSHDLLLDARSGARDSRFLFSRHPAEMLSRILYPETRIVFTETVRHHTAFNPFWQSQRVVFPMVGKRPSGEASD
ncbi:MAG: hypothetical protein WCG03_08875, partial [Kiritimatiellales bacterium]